MTAKEFRNEWLMENQKVVHIASEHELFLMEEYGRQQYNEAIEVAANKSATLTAFSNDKVSALAMEKAILKLKK